ncbi:MAG TPA: tetratricopeptide repeat protein [Steroidobacteraceae bacterium]
MAGGAMQRFWSEIQRRHVPRVAAYYIAAAWVLAQAASLLLDAFDSAHYTRYVIAALVAGMPVALALAWVFDITPQGIRRTLALTDSGAEAPVETPVAAPPHESSIAVLPFANLSDEAANEYFSDGLSEEVRNQLSRVAGLRVAARTSSFAFKGRHEDVREIGRRLNVATVLDGGVRKQGDTVRIDVQLVNAVDGFALWSHTFERRYADIFRLQNEVAQAVLSAVTERQGEALKALPCPQTRDVEAYNWYLLGRHHFHKRTRATLQRACECFESAIAIDPDYALAHTGLADAHMLLCVRYYGNTPLPEAVARALPYARRALELEPLLAEAHASLGLICLNQCELPEAENLLLRAIDLNPGYLLGHLWLGLALTGQGRYAEAAERNREALRLDPLAPIVNTNVGFDAQRFGDVAEAAARFKVALDVDPGFSIAFSGLARQAMMRGDAATALHLITQAVERAPGRWFFPARKALMHLQAGDLDAAGAALDLAWSFAPANSFDCELHLAFHMARGNRSELLRIAQAHDGDYSPLQRGLAYLALGERTAARESYEAGDADAQREIDEILNDDWVWRVPHWLNRAHLRLEAGDARGRADLEHFVERAERVAAQGLVSGEIRYWTGTALGLLGDRERAFAALEAALQAGWRHAWWVALDWNVEPLREDSRFAAWLARLPPGDRDPGSAA